MQRGLIYKMERRTMRTEEEIEAKIVECIDKIEETKGADSSAIGIRAVLEWVIEDTEDLEV